jgi:hypothetical protein
VPAEAPHTKVPVGLATKSALVTVATAFASAVVNALAGGPTSDTITAATVGAATLLTMLVGRYGQAIALHGAPLRIAQIVDRLLDERLKQQRHL